VGTWSAAIFDDDVALDIRQRYLDLLAQGMESDQATRVVVQEFERGFLDVDDGPVLWLALAATQWEYGRLEGDVKERALAAINDERTVERWSGSERRARKAVLASLRQRLLSPARKRRRPPRRRRPVDVPQHSAPGTDGRTVATAFEIAGRTQVVVSMNAGGETGGGGVFVASCRHEDVAIEWLDADTLQITYPSNIIPEARKDSVFFLGRTIRCTYRTG
jgi:hypothetical protein